MPEIQHACSSKPELSANPEPPYWPPTETVAEQRQATEQCERDRSRLGDVGDVVDKNASRCTSTNSIETGGRNPASAARPGMRKRGAVSGRVQIYHGAALGQVDHIHRSRVGGIIKGYGDTVPICVVSISSAVISTAAYPQITEGELGATAVEYSGKDPILRRVCDHPHHC